MFSEYVQSDLGAAQATTPRSQAEARERAGSIRASARQATRSRVMRAAEACFFEAGYEETTIRTIAARADVSVGTVMGVGDKPALLVEVFDTRLAELHLTGAASVDGTTESGDPGHEPILQIADACVSLVRPFVRLFLEHGHLARHYAAILVGGAHGSVTFGRLAETLRGAFRSVLDARGTPQPTSATWPSPDLSAAALHHAYLGVLFSAAGGDELPDEAELLTQLREIFAAISGPLEARS